MIRFLHMIFVIRGSLRKQTDNHLSTSCINLKPKPPLSNLKFTKKQKKKKCKSLFGHQTSMKERERERMRKEKTEQEHIFAPLSILSSISPNHTKTTHHKIQIIKLDEEQNHEKYTTSSSNLRPTGDLSIR